MDCPIKLLKFWVDEERELGNLFPQGAVLCTVARTGEPRSRMVGTMFDEKGLPKFHASPTSRKIDDINFNNNASLTFSFQNSLRSISINGQLTALQNDELEEDWLKYDEDFRLHYQVFGYKSGAVIDSLNELRSERDALKNGVEKLRPDSFIGYKFSTISRIVFYTVKREDFAVSKVFEWDALADNWICKLVVP